ncbi:MAG: exonuclease domain-containing protein [Selenomonadaceae bacterium]|nr:exonuclease domain-containing protein [Selenomonadaceae bacterium]
MIHIVIDLEMNPVRQSLKEIRRQLPDEVIEIGAVKLDDNFKQVDEFQRYVRPEYSKITRHIKKLTGITDEVLEDKNTFAVEFKNFMDWIGTDEVTLYSWSNSDINQLKSECAFKLDDFDVQWLERHWIDLQKEFDDRIGLNGNLALNHAVGAMNKNFKGTQHSALADAINTAAILMLMQDEAEFKRTMQPIIDLINPSRLSSSIGELYPELAALKFDE